MRHPVNKNHLFCFSINIRNLSNFYSRVNLRSIDPNECHRTCFEACHTEQSDATHEGGSLVANSEKTLDNFREATECLRKLLRQLLEFKKDRAKIKVQDNENSDTKSKACNCFKVKGKLIFCARFETD